MAAAASSSSRAPTASMRSATARPSSAGARVAVQRVADPARAVGRARESVHAQRLALRAGVRAHRRVAAGASRATSARSAVRATSAAGSVSAPASRRRARAGAGLQRQAALPGRGQHRLRRDRRALVAAQPPQPGSGQHQRVDDALGQLAQPGVHVAAHARAPPGRAGRPAAGTGGAGWPCPPRRPAGRSSSASAPHSASRGVRALGHPDDRQAVGQIAAARPWPSARARSIRPSAGRRRSP